MNIIGILNEAIGFIEDQMLEPIGNEEVAAHVYMSPYHFHRIFVMITGLSVKEYQRNRRLSLAGEEIVLSKKKLIDIAMTYCYTTPESFTKAFIRFHGISPYVARRTGGGLKMFNRLHIKLTTEGGKTMDYRIEKRSPFRVVTKVRVFSGDVVAETGNHDIPDFWKESQEDGTFEVLGKYAKPSPIYGLCSPLNKTTNHFRYGIGMETDYDEVEDALYEVWEITHPLWAVFKCIGDDPACIGATWDRIFKEFLPGSDYEFVDAPDYELYPYEGEAGVFCEIWIPVGKKE